MVRVAIVGGGIGGLATALLLARRGHTAVVVEREDCVPSGDLDRDFFEWRRPRTPQVVQPHAFLAPVRGVLREEAPDVYADLLARGAREYHEFDWFAEHPEALPGDEDLVAVRTRRIVLETVLNEAVARETRVERRLGTSAEGLVFAARPDDTAPGGVPRVIGLRTAEGVVAADLVIDAAGRRSPVAGWLAEAGCRAPVIESHPVGRAYFSRWYRVRPDGPQNPGKVWDVAVTPFAINLVFPSDNGVFAVTFAVPVEDPRRLALRDPSTFDAAARRFPASGPWLALDPIALGEVQVMAGLDNRWVGFADELGPIVTGLVGVGDSVTHTNPTLGQGVALTLLAAQQVARTAQTAPDDPAAYTAGFYGWAASTLKPWFDHQVRVDSGDQVLFSRRGGDGPPVPPAFDDTTRLQFAATPCAMHDPVVMRARAQVRHLALAPDLAFAEPGVRERLTRWMAEHPGGPGGPGGPMAVSEAEWGELTGATVTARAPETRSGDDQPDLRELVPPSGEPLA